MATVVTAFGGTTEGTSASDAHTRGTARPAADATCTVRDVLGRVGDTWSILVIAALERRPHRFRELLRAVDGISQRMLTVTLRRLERDGLVSRTVEPTRPPQVEYALTALGRSLTVPLRAVADWSRSHQRDVAAHRARWDADQADAGQPAGGTTRPTVR